MRNRLGLAMVAILAINAEAQSTGPDSAAKRSRPQQLDSVRVVAEPGLKPARYANTTKFDAFYERKRSATAGHFLTREDLERDDKDKVMEILRTLPGVKIRTNRLGDPVMTFARCVGSNMRNPMAPAPREGGDPETPIQVFIDGMKVIEPFQTLSKMSAREVEAMEIYTGASQLPQEARGNGCGAIFVWTRYTPGSVLANKQ